MLQKLHFKNWRNLRDVTIDNLTPITVFIGANSSGKTNILDGLYFLRESCQKGVLHAVQNRGGMEKIHALGTDLTTPIEIEITYSNAGKDLTYLLGLEFDRPDFPIPNVAESLQDSTGKHYLEANYRNSVNIYHPDQETMHPLADAPFGWEQTVLSTYGNVAIYREIYETFQYLTHRWQLLDENFMPPLSLQTGASGDLLNIDPCADNVPIMLDFMMKVEPALYEQLQSDLRWLLGHIDKLETYSDEHETRIALQEKTFRGTEAPTISAGTARLVAILTAVHTLNHKQRINMPGLVVIEEPDTALNPWLLQSFMEQLRNYVSREYPRQFILTTHNPRLLDYFEPNEVRIIQRDEQGYASVKHVPQYIQDIWLDEYKLGEVWATGSLGGVPQ